MNVLVKYKIENLTSRLNNTPPIGDPNATDMPAAAAAERTSRFRAVNFEFNPNKEAVVY